MQENLKTCEHISALADGQLRGEEFAQTVEWVAQDDNARATWQTYHLVGDVLRSGESVTNRRDAAFVHRLRLAVQQEARVHEESDLIANYPLSTPPKAINVLKNASANDANFRWKMVAGLASLMAVSIVAWQAFSGLDSSSHNAQLVLEMNKNRAPSVPLAQVGPNDGSQVMIRDPQLDALLAAHRQFGGTSALQMPAGFLRNATFESADR